jgi:DNA-binding CsgD family transcriptional regulator
VKLARLIEDFEEECGVCATPGELFDLTEAAARDLGFDRLAMVHSLWFRCPEKRLIRLDNFGEFADLFITRKYYQYDPALLACQRINTAFTWTQMCKLIRFDRRHEVVLREAGRHGLCIGMSLPVSVVGEPPGCVSFATRNAALPSRWRCRAAALIGASAFREARRLHGYPGRAMQFPHLSPRKLEILQLAALGKTDPEISIILGLARSTIETYMTQLRQTFDVYSRTQLCVAALRFGLIAFDDAISGF